MHQLRRYAPERYIVSRSSDRSNIVGRSQPIIYGKLRYDARRWDRPGSYRRYIVWMPLNTVFIVTLNTMLNDNNTETVIVSKIVVSSYDHRSTVFIVSNRIGPLIPVWSVVLSEFSGLS